MEPYVDRRAPNDRIKRELCWYIRQLEDPVDASHVAELCTLVGKAVQDHLTVVPTTPCDLVLRALEACTKAAGNCSLSFDSGTNDAPLREALKVVHIVNFYSAGNLCYTPDAPLGLQAVDWMGAALQRGHRADVDRLLVLFINGVHMVGWALGPWATLAHTLATVAAVLAVPGWPRAMYDQVLGVALEVDIRSTEEELGQQFGEAAEPANVAQASALEAFARDAVMLGAKGMQSLTQDDSTPATRVSLFNLGADFVLFALRVLVPLVTQHQGGVCCSSLLHALQPELQALALFLVKSGGEHTRPAVELLLPLLHDLEPLRAAGRHWGIAPSLQSRIEAAAEDRRARWGRARSRWVYAMCVQ